MLVAAIAAPASAYWSASRGGSIYTHRYLVCDEASAKDDARCVGTAAAKPQLHAALTVGSLAPGTNHDHEVDGAIDAMIAMIHANDRDALPAIRKLLAIQLDAQDRNEHSLFDKQAVRAEAANALAHLGDTSCAQAIEDLVTELETDGYGTLWADTLAALAVLDPDRASAYAARFLDRASDFRMSMPGGSDKLAALDYLRDPSALPMLERLAKAEENGYDHAYCRFMATRVRLDGKLHAKVRDMFAGHYSGSWLAGCDTDVMKAFGTEAADAAVLVRHFGRDDAGLDFGMANVSFGRALELIASGKLDAKNASVIDKGLKAYATYPQIVDPTNENYSPHLIAYVAAAQAGLGDAAARTRLYTIVDDANDTTGTAWLAAYWALRLRLPDAADHAGALVLRGLQYGNSERSGIYASLRARTLDAYADAFPDDPRWTVGLLSPQDWGGEAESAEHVLYRVSRHTPAGTCATVTAAAASATRPGAEFGLLALTSLGCGAELGQLADRGGLELRGLALQMVAAMRDPDLCAHLSLAKRDGVPAADIAWARSLHDTRCEASRHGDQPLPPRVYRQGY